MARSLTPPRPPSAPPRVEIKTYQAVDTEILDYCRKAALPARTKRFVLTTDALDRDGDVVLPQGMHVSQ
jgi:hypothetical protein